MGQSSSYNIFYQLKKSFSTFDKRVNLEYHIIKGKLKENEVKENREKIMLNFINKWLDKAAVPRVRALPREYLRQHESQ